MPLLRLFGQPPRPRKYDVQGACRYNRARLPAPDGRRNRAAASSSLLSVLPVARDQRVGRTVMFKLRRALALQLGDDSLGQHFAQLDTPLVERVDVPYRTLGKH